MLYEIPYLLLLHKLTYNGTLLDCVPFHGCMASMVKERGRNRLPGTRDPYKNLSVSA